MGLRNQAEGGLLLVAVAVVVVVVYTQVHGEDGCSCGGHLHGQCCCAHVHCKTRQAKQSIINTFYYKKSKVQKRTHCHYWSALQFKIPKTVGMKENPFPFPTKQKKKTLFLWVNKYIRKKRWIFSASSLLYLEYLIICISIILI